MTRAQRIQEKPLLEQPVSWNELIDQQFGRLIVIGYTGAKTSFGQKKITCKCTCEDEVYIDVMVAALRSGNTTSCGCVHREKVQDRNIAASTHGNSRGGEITPEYRAWVNMIARCHNSHHKSWCYYGGIGIEVCPQWRKSSVLFLEYIGRRPTPGHSLDRYPNNRGNYEPGNVRWATAKEQVRNQRNTKRFLFEGAELTIGEMSEQTGVDRELLYSRIVKYGWSIPDAVSTIPGGRTTDELYGRWWQMVHRCTNPKSERWADYGGRGIGVCDRWRYSFKAYVEDVGLPLPGQTLDRIDNEKGYEPGNVRWATYTQQGRNRRNTVTYTINGETRGLKEWAQLAEIPYITVNRRVHTGWSLEDALGTKPVPSAKRTKWTPPGKP